MIKNVKIAPSVLSADFSKIGEEVVRIEKAGADVVHLDVMDGVFVPNITFGIKMVKDMRKVSSLPFDCHLMIVNPEKHVEQFALLVQAVHVVDDAKKFPDLHFEHVLPS